ncbi:hypothetical protein [Labilithrix luteola]|uniref:hypothetical protein n=1 Tax=Labilithrix luteola TaxID=1391654 RepID=UPI0011BAB6D6|nr:hypothetical protein [Labilithrix luteola]
MDFPFFRQAVLPMTILCTALTVAGAARPGTRHRARHTNDEDASTTGFQTPCRPDPVVLPAPSASAAPASPVR